MLRTWRNLAHVVAITVCVLLSARLFAAPSTGLLWEVRQGDQINYLLGSVHFADSELYPLSPAILQAFDQSQVLLVEVDDTTMTLEAQQALLMQYGLYPAGKTLTGEYSPATLSVIKARLQEFDVPLKQVERYRPGMLAVTLATMQAAKLGYSAEQGIDRYFMQKARYKKTIRQIETFAQQMALLAELPEDEALVRDSFANMDDYEDMWSAMMQSWRQGDADRMYAAAIGEPLAEFPKLAPFYEKLFYSRHPRMVASVEACFQQRERCFVVVGAGHIVGPRGLVDELAKLGYQVRQVR